MYCAVTDVEFRLQVDFDATTNPTDGAVTAIINQVSARIDLTLGGAGIALPISDAGKLLALKNICSLGSAGMVGMTYGRNFDNITQSQAKFYWEEFLKELNLFCSNYSGTAIIPGLNSGSLRPIAGGERPEKEVDW